MNGLRPSNGIATGPRGWASTLPSYERGTTRVSSRNPTDAHPYRQIRLQTCNLNVIGCQWQSTVQSVTMHTHWDIIHAPSVETRAGPHGLAMYYDPSYSICKCGNDIVHLYLLMTMNEPQNCRNDDTLHTGRGSLTRICLSPQGTQSRVILFWNRYK